MEPHTVAIIPTMRDMSDRDRENAEANLSAIVGIIKWIVVVALVLAIWQAVT